MKDTDTNKTNSFTHTQKNIIFPSFPGAKIVLPNAKIKLLIVDMETTVEKSMSAPNPKVQQSPQHTELTPKTELSSFWFKLQNCGPVEFQQNLLRKVWLSSSWLGAEPASQTWVSLTGSC